MFLFLGVLRWIGWAMTTLAPMIIGDLDLECGSPPVVAFQKVVTVL